MSAVRGGAGGELAAGGVWRAHGRFGHQNSKVAGTDRAPLIQALIRIDAEKLRTVLEDGPSAAAWSATWLKKRGTRATGWVRLSTLNYFLRFRSPAMGTTDADLAWCDMLAEKLRAKGQWTGECHPE